MGRMRQMSIERVDAVDEPATGHRWVIAKRSKQADAKPESAELVKAAIEALHKDAELDISDEAGEALRALAEAHGLEFKLEKDEADAEPEADEAAADADADAEADADADEAADEDADEDDAEGDADADADEDADDEEEADEDDDPLAKRLDTLEKAMELLIEKLDATPADRPTPRQTTEKRTRKSRTSKQPTGQDNLDGEPLSKSNGRVDFTNVVFNQ